jgi:hypothetical protein
MSSGGVQSALHTSAAEVVRDALRHLRKHDELHAQRVERVRARIEGGWQQPRRSETVHRPEALRKRASGSKSAHVDELDRF